MQCQAYRRGVLGEELHAPDGAQELLFGDDDPIGIAVGDQLAVVRELTLDEAGGEPGVADRETGFVSGQKLKYAA